MCVCICVVYVVHVCCAGVCARVPLCVYVCMYACYLLDTILIFTIIKLQLSNTHSVCGSNLYDTVLYHLLTLEFRLQFGQAVEKNAQ